MQGILYQKEEKEGQGLHLSAHVALVKDLVGQVLSGAFYHQKNISQKDWK